MADFATTPNLSRYNEKVTHTVTRTVTLREYQGDSASLVALETRRDIERILGMVDIRVKEIHTSVVTYQL